MTIAALHALARRWLVGGPPEGGEPRSFAGPGSAWCGHRRREVERLAAWLATSATSRVTADAKRWSTG